MLSRSVRKFLCIGYTNRYTRASSKRPIASQHISERWSGHFPIHFKKLGHTVTIAETVEIETRVISKSLFMQIKMLLLLASFTNITLQFRHHAWCVFTLFAWARPEGLRYYISTDNFIHLLIMSHLCYDEAWLFILRHAGSSLLLFLKDWDRITNTGSKFSAWGLIH